MKTPILLLIFNRPDQTRRVFAEIRKARPEKLFVAGDGPRAERPEDVEKCKRARDIVKEIDWKCDIKTLFQEKNLGCKFGATTGITWFFDNVEEGIILEDDCLPDQSFFPFCEQMLARYRNEEKIAMICGYNIGGSSDIKFSYTFSRYGHLWGWASWRRVWEKYDVTMKLWADKKNWKKIKYSMGDRRQWNYRQLLYNETFLGKKDTWDYQWESFRLLRKELSVIPSKNLIENLGFGADATHTTQMTSPLIISRREMDFPLIHNERIQPDDSYDIKLRPKIPARGVYARQIKDIIKKFSKNMTPPCFYEFIRRKIKTKKFRPIWNELKYKPLNGIKLFFDPTGPWQKKMLEGSYDSFLFDRLKTMNLEGKIIFDIGAHIGYHSIYFSKLVGKNGKIFAFEPHLKNIERFKLILEKNKNGLDNISVYDFAISDKVGTEEFNLNEDIESGRSSGNFIGHADTFWNRSVYLEKGFNKISVKTYSVDSLKDNLGINILPDIIKIDVEGAEYLVLLGARQILKIKKPILFIEIHSILDMFNVASFLFSLEYNLTILRKESSGICFIEATPRPFKMPILKTDV